MTDLSDIQQLDWSTFWRVLPKDIDPVETREWLGALESVIENEGPERATYLLRKWWREEKRRGRYVKETRPGDLERR
jgi:pyruvate dehydrogenase complex dehydrogenase (E1) component